jgi:L-asparaginase / beta-aspartyl-peptidase
MEGKTLNAGAVARVTDIKNPILAARKVMENSEHVLLSSNGASEFARNKVLRWFKTNIFLPQHVLSR